MGRYINMELLTRNSKMVKTDKVNNTRTFNFGISAYKASDNTIICKQALNCVSDCYARQGTYIFSNVKNAYDLRYQESKKASFVASMIHAIGKKRNVTHIRIHDSGDFYGKAYLNKWVKIMNACPDIIFYGYTKEVMMLKSTKLPSNFIPIFSYGGKQDHLINPKKDRHSRVFDKHMALNYVDASNDDHLAIGNNKRVGLIYHGQKKIKGFLKVGA